ncbi:DHA2 family efflux MFS transporter permease subunit [Aromatoleum toluclasticum]|uniref:DHA2 family efflux MFS transporter permease subunit n=1 Tax=Aromatoleum toluclasticum TaxID=92003 RepID=UPI001D1827D3|nr:DHA2 family efflux MFS transporter permease subunit [Aromatoleum toluclasticum]MCC4116854.1 DHA2 family efflux MFS transporter permease subunit [Aromatoleum toluclasticum]
MTHNDAQARAPLEGGMLWAAAIVLATANFVAVLDMTIANVSVPNIAGGLAATNNQATWVITSYAVAEAITVPLTGWLAARFGGVRVFVTAMALFGLFSALCGLAGSLGMLVAARVLQGLAGGPLMPLSQTLLMRIFPPSKASAAIGLWAMTTLVAPVLGPIIGGWICDNWSWPWIFHLNLPLALACAAGSWRLLKRYEQPVVRDPVDRIGLVLLIVWVGALQLMLDEGKDLDWFASPKIIALAAVAATGFAAFLIWELTAEHPAVDLRVFRHRGFTAGVVTNSLAIAALFAANVLTPLWLQTWMGYSASDAGTATAWTGLVAVFFAPVAAMLSARVDARRVVFGGVLALALITLWRTDASTDMDYWQISYPLMAMGAALPFFFIPLTGLALGCVDAHETASAAGLMNFLRTVSGAFATSLATTAWDDLRRANHAELAGYVDPERSVVRQLQASGLDGDGARLTLDRLLDAQSVMLATNEVMSLVAVAFFVAACAVWLAPRPAGPADRGLPAH